MANVKDPIDLMKELEADSENDTDSTNQLNVENQTYNTYIETNIKQDQLNKFHNDKLNKQLQQLKELESNIINKDRLIEQTNDLNTKNDTNINTLYVSLSLALIVFLSIILYSMEKLNDRLLGIIITMVILIFTLIILYTYNIFHFKTAVNFLDIRKNLQLQQKIKDTGKNIEKRIQEKIYGDKRDWLDENCDCPDTEDIYTDEENIAVEIKPGYFYYDKNAPKQNIIPSGGQKINVSADPNKTINDKIQWVNHDSKSSDIDAEDYNYNINPNNNDLHKNGIFVNDTTYTVNL